MEGLQDKIQSIKRYILKSSMPKGLRKRSRSIEDRERETFSHVITVHNANIIWSIPSRNALYRLLAFQEQYMALTYYMSSSAVKALRELHSVENKEQQMTQGVTLAPTANVNDQAVEDMIKKLTNEQVEGNHDKAKSEHMGEYELKRNFAVQLLHPQFRLQTSVSASSMIYLVSEKITLQSTAVTDPGFENDENNEEVKTQFRVSIKDLQLLLAFRSQFESSHFGYSSFDYGVGPGGLWPVWVPLEVLVDHDGEPGLFQRMVGRTSATLSYDKLNPLRIAKTIALDTGLGHELAENTTRSDVIDVELPQLALILDPGQFQEILTMVSDLLIYKEPVTKERLEQIKSVMISADAGEFGNVADFVVGLQEKVRTLRRIIKSYDSKVEVLNDSQIADYASVSQQVADLENYLYVVMEGINRSQNQSDKSKEAQKSVRFSLLAEEVFWLMLMPDREPLCQTSIKGASLVWLMNEDNSSVNTLEVVYISILNRIPNSPFTEVLQPNSERRASIDFTRRKMIRMLWRELAPVAGIEVVEHFEVNVYPLKIQLTYEIGKQLMNYFFPDKKQSISDGAVSSAQITDANIDRKPSYRPDGRKGSISDTLSVSESGSGGGADGSRRTGTSIVTGAQVNQSISTMKSRASEVFFAYLQLCYKIEC